MIVENNENLEILISSELCMYRNLKNIPFPQKLRTQEGINLSEKIAEIFSKNEKYKFKKVSLWQESKENTILYLDNFIISHELYENRRFSSFLFDDENNIVVMINEENHITVLVKNTKLKFDKLYNIANDLLDKVSEELEFAYSEEFGYLTSSLKKMGTAVKADNILHLPLLNKISVIEELTLELDKVGITLENVFSKDDKNVGNLFKISNKYTLGITEEEIFDDLEAITYQVIMKEKKARTVLGETDVNELYDWIFRAKGIITNARKMSFNEVLELASMIRLGLEMKVINNITSMQINESILASQSNKIKSFFKEDENVDSSVKRADYIRRVFKDI